MTRISAATLAFAMGLATSLQAANAPTAPEQNVVSLAKVKATIDPDAKICKTIDSTGSRLGGSKTCLTRREWADVARDGGDFTAARQLGSNRASTPR